MSEGHPIFYCLNCLNTFAEDVEACTNLSCTRQRPVAGWGQMYGTGDIIDRNYEVIERLAVGGAGVTYLVRALDDDGAMSGPKVALKLLFTSRDHGAYLRRLSTEAQILQELHHPNIVRYLGFVHRTGQSPYLLTHFEEGGNLLDFMRRHGKLTIRQAAEVGRQVCWALEKGHAQGIIHRDLKPENLLLTEEPQPGESPIIRVADFGIAKVKGSLNSGLTRAGAFVGTPQYAAPEQFLGEAASDKADVYSVGALMVFLMTAKPLVKDAHLLASEDVYTEILDALPPTIHRQSESIEDIQGINQILALSMTLEPGDRCTVAGLDRMLGHLLAGNDPCLSVDPSPPLPVTSSSFPVTASPSLDHGEPELSSTNTLVAQSIDGQDEPTVKTIVGSGPPLPTTDLVAENPPRSNGVRWFIYGTMAAIILGFVGWFMAVSSVTEPESIQQEVSATQVVPTVPTEKLPEEPIAPEVEVEAVVSDVVTPEPAFIDAVSNPSKGVQARKAAVLSFKRNASNIRRLCSQAVGTRLVIEAMVSTNGRISQARPVNKTGAQFRCVADNMVGVKTGSRLPMATKVRLSVEP